MSRPFPAARRHGQLEEVLPDVFFVTGGMAMPGLLPIRFSRNMVVVREGSRLVLINTVRLDDAGLEALDKLGKVSDVVRIAGNHGMDDPFYADRYGAKVWAVKGQRYTAGFDANQTNAYFTPSVEMDATTELPIDGAKLYVIGSTPPEALLVLDRHGGTIIAGDCLQNWAAPDVHFSWLARIAMKRMKFIVPHNIGPAWLKQGKPPKQHLRGILDEKFANVLPAHGTPVIGGAAELFRPVIERASANS